MSEYEILEVRKVPDKSSGTRVERYDPETGEKKLVNPETPGEDHESWPLLGVTVDKPPQFTSAGMRWADEAVRAGWMRRIGERPVPRPGGPLDAPWTVAHVFIHADKIIIEDLYNGEVVYRVTRQPDKFYTDASGVYEHPVEEYGMLDDEELATAEVAWFYLLELESVGANNG